MIRPTEAAVVIARAPGVGGEGLGGAAVLVQRRWGFAPAAPRAGDAPGGAGRPRARPPVINFRSEGRRFRTGERVLVLASHFFEYTGARSPKTRWRFTKAERGGGAGPGEGSGEGLGEGLGGGSGADEDPFAIAGLLRAAPAGPDAARTSAGEPWPESFTMLTTAPGPDVAPLHDRQVVVLDRADWARWLWGAPEDAAALLRPSPAGTLRVAQDAR